jgi:hypothetical protein
MLTTLRSVILISLVAVSCNPGSIAQELHESGPFELSVQGLSEPSIATVTPNELAIRDPAGTITRYLRSARYDTADQQLLGYSSRQAQQVIRWPSTNSGRMQIGSLQNGQIQFAWSKMTVTNSQQPNSRILNTDILPPGFDSRSNSRIRGSTSTNDQPGNLQNLPSMTAMHLSVGNPNDRQFLGLRGGNQFGFSSHASDTESAWYITPVSDNMVRLQQRHQNDWLAIGLGNAPDGMMRSSRLNQRTSSIGGANNRRSNVPFPITLLPIHNGADQLWRIQTIQGAAGYCFESVLYPGMGLTCIPNQGLALQNLTYDPWQIWWPQSPTFAVPQPQFRTVQQQVVPNAPLRPVSARIVNSHTDTLIVLVADRRHSQSIQKLRIPAGGSERIQLDRDPGASIVETIETMDAFGNWNQQQFNTPIPPTVLYDMSVYEEFLQSIAIDRTGKSPNPIEDINYQPRSIGLFLVPPGNELPENADIDVYRIAEDAQNPGAVRRLNPRDLQKSNATPETDPLKELLNKFQKQRAAF